MARCEYSCAYLLPIAHTRLRVHRASGIPHALCFRGGCFWQTSGVSGREIAKLCFLMTQLLKFASVSPPLPGCFFGHGPGDGEPSRPPGRLSPDCRRPLLLASLEAGRVIRVVPPAARIVISPSRESVSCSRMGTDAMSEECPE